TGSLIGAATELGASSATRNGTPVPAPRATNGGNGLGRPADGFGAWASGEVSPRRRHYRRFGDTLGVAFQIVDDLLDYLGTPQVTGKPVGSDLAEGKVTLPLIAALRSATEADRRVLKR